MPSNRQRVKELFQDALERPQPERTVYLRGVCGGDDALMEEVLSLLKEASNDDDDTTVRREQPGETIGHYKLLQEIGTGGFGTVWMAEQQEPVRRKVALKILKLGMDTRQVVTRFEAERQALALMDHPNIAKVFDGGATATGRPYFVMELVKGVPITSYCDEAQLGTTERIGLFVSVCQAVQHAHQKGVIHRDLKPSNVLVALHDGVPVVKVIDFGIAKATSGALTDKTLFTEFRQMLGTPEYMAPEQAGASSLDVDTRADVYSLGVLLYELLTGRRPLELRDAMQAGYLEMLRRIQEDEPPKPSTRITTLAQQELLQAARHRQVHPRALGRLMRGELDWVVMKALAKERSRRYETASAFAEDLQRHLRHEPVQAGPPSRVYRLRKYVQRHWVGAAASAAIGASLVTGLAVSLYGLRKARDQTHVAATQASRARQVATLLREMLGSSDPSQMKGPGYTVRQLLDDFDAELGTQLASEPEVEAEMRRTIGMSYLGLGLVAAAEPHLQRALVLRGATALDAPAVAESRLDLAQVAIAKGRYRQARSSLAEWLAAPRDPAGSDVEVRERALLLMCDALTGLAEVAAMRQILDELRGRLTARGATAGRAWANLLDREASRLLALGQTQAAEALQREAVAEIRACLPEEHPQRLTLEHNLALLCRVAHKHAEAKQLYLDNLDKRRRVLGERHPSTASSQAGLAQVFQTLGNYERARQLLQEALQADWKLLDPGHPTTAFAMREMARVLHDFSEFPAAEDLYRRALASYRAAYGDEHPDVAWTMNGLGILLVDLARHEEAEKLLRSALALRIDFYGAEHPMVAHTKGDLAALLRSRGRPEKAEAMLRDAVRILTAHAGSNPGDDLAIALNNLGVFLRNKGDLPEAARAHERALEIRRQVHGENHPEVANSLMNLACVRGDQGDLQQSETLTRQALESLTQVFSAEHVTVATLYNNLAFLANRQQRPAEAAKLHRQALEIREKLLDPNHPDVAQSCAGLGDTLANSLGDPAAAEPLLRRALTIALEKRGPDHEFTGAVRSLLMGALVAMGRAGEATEQGRELWRSAERSLPAGHELRTTRLRNLVALLLRQQLAAEAEPLAQVLLAELQASKVDAVAVGQAESLLGGCLLGLGRLDEAEKQLLSAVERLPAKGATLAPLRTALERLIELYERSGRPAESKKWRERRDALPPAR